MPGDAGGRPSLSEASTSFGHLSDMFGHRTQRFPKTCPTSIPSPFSDLFCTVQCKDVHGMGKFLRPAPTRRQSSNLCSCLHMGHSIACALLFMHHSWHLAKSLV